MADGSQLMRSYDLQLYSTDLEDPNSVASLLNSIVNAPGSAEDAYFSGVESLDAFGNLVEASLQSVYDAGQQTYTDLDVLTRGRPERPAGGGAVRPGRRTAGTAVSL